MRWISVFVILIAAWPAAQAVAGEPSDDKLAFIEARLDASRDAAGLWRTTTMTEPSTPSAL